MTSMFVDPTTTVDADLSSVKGEPTPADTARPDLQLEQRQVCKTADAKADIEAANELAAAKAELAATKAVANATATELAAAKAAANAKATELAAAKAVANAKATELAAARTETVNAESDVYFWMRLFTVVILSAIVLTWYNNNSPTVKPTAAEAEDEDEASKGKTEDLRAQLDTATAQAADLNAAVNHAKAEAAALRAQLDTATAQAVALRAQLDTATAEAAALRAQLDTKELADAEVVMQRATDAERMARELEEFQGKLCALREEVATAEKRATDAEKRAQEFLQCGEARVSAVKREIHLVQCEGSTNASKLVVAERDAEKAWNVATGLTNEVGTLKAELLRSRYEIEKLQLQLAEVATGRSQLPGSTLHERTVICFHEEKQALTF